MKKIFQKADKDRITWYNPGMLGTLQKRIFPDPQKGDWQSWRETILAHCLFLGSILICACFIPSILLLTYEKKYLLLWLSCTAFACFMGLFWLKTLPYALRAYSVCFLLFAMGVIITAFRGPFTSSLLWYILAAIAAIVLINRRAALWMCGCNLLAVLVTGAIIATAPPASWNLLTHAPLINWGITGLIFASIQFIVIFSLDFLLRSAQQAFKREQQLSASLTAEIHSHARTNQALQQSEAHFRKLVEASHLAIALVEDKDRYTYVNPGFTDIFGYTLDQVPTVSDWLAKGLPDPEARLVAQTQWTGDLAALRPGMAIERMLSYTCQDKQKKEIKIRPVVLDHRQHLVTYEDCTRQASLENRVRQTHKMEALGTLTSGVAHDFNNILNIIIGYCEIAMLEATQQDDTLENIRQAGVRARDIVKQLLFFIQKANPEKTPVDLGLILSRNIKLLKASLPPGIEFLTQIPEGLPWVTGDPSQLDQVIINLFTNAVQSFGNRGGTILAALETDADPAAQGAEIRLVMTDTGSGIAPEHLDRIFDPYFTTRDSGKGSGLGLSVVLGIVESHDGTIEVSSEPGKGTQVTVSLPATAEKLQKAPVPPDQGLPKGSETIMVVDDEPRIIDVTERYLTWLGYRVRAFTRPADALADFARHPARIDLVITDKGMPDMSGEALARAMHDLRQDIPILLCTGFHEGISQTDLKRSGISLLMEKPVTLSQLGKNIRDLLDQLPRR